MALNGALARTGVDTEPGGVPARAARDDRNVREGIAGVFLCVGSGSVDLRLLGLRAAGEGNPLFVNAGYSKIAGELQLGNILNSRVEIPIGIDVGEEVRWFNGIASSARSSEVVHRGY